jgi:hypothetical protein
MRAGSTREAAIAVATVAAVSANNSLRFMATPLRDIFIYQGRAAVWAGSRGIGKTLRAQALLIRQKFLEHRVLASIRDNNTAGWIA